MRGVGLNLDHLVDDFPCGQIAAEAHPARGAESAAHRAAHLGTDANHVLEVFGPVQQGNADRLERFRAVAAKCVLGESVLRRDDLLQQRQVAGWPSTGRLRPAVWRQCLVPGGQPAVPHAAHEPASLGARQAHVRQAVVQLLGGKVFRRIGIGASRGDCNIPWRASSHSHRRRLAVTKVMSQANSRELTAPEGNPSICTFRELLAPAIQHCFTDSPQTHMVGGGIVWIVGCAQILYELRLRPFLSCNNSRIVTCGAIAPGYSHPEPSSLRTFLCPPKFASHTSIMALC